MGFWSRLRNIHLRFGRAIFATAVSQGISAAAIFLLPFTLAASLSDDYAMGIQTGVAGFSGISIGVVYNLALGRPQYRRWRLSALLAGLASPVLGAITYLLLMVFHGQSLVHESTVPVLAIFSVGGAALAYGGVFAARLACLGRPIRLMTTTLAPSIALVAGLVIFQMTGGMIGMLTPALLWASTAIVQALLLHSRMVSGPSEDLVSAQPHSSNQVGRHTAYLILGAFTATVLPNVYMVALTQLPAGTLVWVFIVGRIGTAIVGLGVNTLLTVVYTWKKSPRSPVRLLRNLAICGFISAAVSITLRFSEVYWAGRILSVGSWLLLLIAAAVALRYMNFRADVGPIGMKTVADVVISVPFALFFAFAPSISGYFGVFAISQAVTLIAAAYSLRDRLLGWTSALCLISSAGLVVAGW